MICLRLRRKQRFLTFLLIGALFTVIIYICSYNIRGPDDWGFNVKLGIDQESYMDKQGIRVIVGHYIGGAVSANLTPEIANANNYAPIPGAGDGGRPIQLPSRDIIRARDLFPLHGFNILASDRVPLNRSLPDMRSPSCRARDINLRNLPTASVIIVFHNEAWSSLMRTVTSVILRSPSPILKEVILVDDASDRKYLKEELETAVAKLGIVRLLRAKSRAGLVAARLQGAHNATGDALVFLDAHCEVTIGWLPPLLDRAGKADVFVCPHIDLISDDTMAYVRSTDAHWGAFSRRLHFRWLTPSVQALNDRAKEPAKSYPTPAMAGGLFAVRRDLFWKLGGYDEGMYVWGGENLELSWRAWQCGARVEIDPCSRVGHIFRRQSPYTFPGGVASVLHANLARAAAVWMDDWAEFFFLFNPQVASKLPSQDVQQRKELRTKLGCKSFEWYLKTVWPQHFFPAKDRWFGRVRSSLGPCMALGNTGLVPGIGGPAYTVRCTGDRDLDGLLVYTEDGLFMADEGLCLEVGNNGRVIWRGCSGADRQQWNQQGSRLKTKDGRCMSVGTSISDGAEVAPLVARKCIDIDADNQIWKLERVPWK